MIPDPASKLSELQRYIVATHHAFTRQASETISVLAARVSDQHAARHPEVIRVRTLVTRMFAELVPHMLKEEEILFPYIECLETGRPGAACFGTVRNPIRAMLTEHDSAVDMLAELRRLTSDYTLPDDACLNFRALYETLQALEADLVAHIDLENEHVFPRAIALEEAAVPA